MSGDESWTTSQKALVTPCPDDNTLAQFAEGELASERMVSVQEHVDACSACLAVIMDVAVGLRGGERRLAALPFQPPDQFEEYRILRPLGGGAMGQVFAAHDTLLDRKVAVKFIAVREPSESARERFRIEARAIARLSHPNVVAIHRVGVLDGHPYLVSELVDGESLDKVLKPLPEAKVVQIGTGLARGLAAVHRQGILHRDVKPGNAIIATGGEVKLLDFGLAKLLDNPSLPESAGRPNPSPETADFARRSHASAGNHSVGAFIGTPAYMAPEVWRREPATQQTDLYSLGALLYHVASGNLPHHAPTVADLRRRVCERDAPPLAEAAPSINPRVAAIVDRCLRRVPEERFASAEEMVRSFEQLNREQRAVQIPEGNPYRGLQSFDAEHRPLFFGRGADVRTVLERLRSEAFVLVTGDSGVGKSSLCRAGVLPAVAEDVGDSSPPWSIVSFVPGRYPLDSLVAALAPSLEMEEAALADLLRCDPTAAARALRRLGGRRTLVFVDQMEELLTLGRPAEAVLVGEILAAFAIASPGVRLLGVVRGDFLTRLATLLGLGEELPRALYLLSPLSASDLREVVVAPARMMGFRFQSEEMIREVVESSAGTEGGLPLLQFALAELWGKRVEAQRLLPASALDALGGVTGALARHADHVLASLPPEQRAAARTLFGHLITTEGTRARRTEEELVARCGAMTRLVLHALLQGRLIVARADETGASSYELAHEALLDGWDTLRGWLANDAEIRAARQRLERAAAEWERCGRASELLWERRQLTEASGAVDLTPREKAFVIASRRALLRRRTARIVLGAAGPFIALVAYATFLVAGRLELNRRVSALVTEAERTIAQARAAGTRADDASRHAFQLFDADPAQDANAESAWADARRLAAGVDKLFQRADRSLEDALALDPGRSGVRARIGDVLYERALCADGDGRRELRDELLAHLSHFDADGSRRRRWNAPAHLDVATNPVGADVAIESCDATGCCLGPRRALGNTPLTGVEVPRGSHVLVLAAPGRASVRYPILLGRDERLLIAVDLPRPGAVPDGYIYVPPGRFLYGSDADEDARRTFFRTVPLHTRITGAYLIARTEVTYRDWISFLESLPPKERERHLPIAEGHQSHRLALLPSSKEGWRLSMGSTVQSYEARLGEPIRYRDRDRRSEADWLNFPVAGVDYGSATDYAGWLDGTKRLPGARLCRELEWERAARGADSRHYPHGDTLGADDANHDATYGRSPRAFGPDEVGSHSASRSPFGVDDMAGNVWEWTSAGGFPGPYVMRGGDWYAGAITAISANREFVEPTVRDASVGLRICADVAAQ